MLKKYKQLIIGIVIGALLFGIVPIMSQGTIVEAFLPDITIILDGTPLAQLNKFCIDRGF